MDKTVNDMVVAKRKGKPAIPPVDKKEKPIPGGVYDKKKASAPFPKADKDFPYGKN